MTTILYSLIIGVLLLGMLGLLVRGGKRRSKPGIGFNEAHEAMTALQSELLPPQVVQRIFAREDLDYARAQSVPEVELMLQRERKLIALAWLAEVRATVRCFMRFHLKSARYQTDLNVASEMQLAASYLLFIFAYRLFAAFLWMGGPFTVATLLGHTTQAATRLCTCSMQVLARIDPAASQPRLRLNQNL